jgi:uncharacterized membrane protein
MYLELLKVNTFLNFHALQVLTFFSKIWIGFFNKILQRICKKPFHLQDGIFQVRENLAKNEKIEKFEKKI